MIPPPLTDAHMIVLACIAVGQLVDRDDIAAALAWPVAVVEQLCADLETAGMVYRPPMH